MGSIRSFLLLISFTSTLAVASLHASEYDDAIRAARAGHFKRALPLIRKRWQEEPKNMNVLYDYITVLSWAGKDHEALTLAHKTNLHTVPEYLLRSLAKSARNSKDYKRAVKLYILGAERFPDIPDYYIGLANTLQDMHRTKLAVRVWQKAVTIFPKDDTMKLSLASAYEREHDWFDAMAIYEKLLQKPKLHDKVVVRLVGTLRRLGMPFKAEEYIEKNPALFDKEVLTSLKSDQAAYRLRWFASGLHPEGDLLEGEDTLRQIDSVIKKLQSGDADLHTDKRLQNAWFDRIIALHALGHDKEACMTYDALKAANLKIPPYVGKAAGESFLAIRKPFRAQKIFRQALRQNPGNFKLKTDLFYAYSDAYDMHKARQWARKLDKNEPMHIWDKNHLKKIPNPRKETTLLLKALADEYSGYIPKARRQIEALVAVAPMNTWYKQELAQLYFYQGKYAKSQKLFNQILAYDPENFDAKAAQINLLIAQNEYGRARSAMERLSLAYAHQKKALRELTKTYRARTAGYFQIQSGINRGDKNSLGQNSDGYHVNSALYSPLFASHWRLYLSGNILHSRFSGDELHNQRYGMGTRYVSKTLEGDLKIVYNDAVIKRLTPAANLTWHISDTMSLGSGYAWFWDGTPDRAILSGIRANHYHTTFGYRKNAFTALTLTYAGTDYSDGNHADNVDLTMQTRLIYGPYYNLDAILYSGTGQNRKQNRVYYAPQEERYVTLSLVNSWNLYTLYERQIVQKVVLEGGTHWEKGYGSQTTGAAEIAQEWQWNDRFGFDFGIRRSRASYDGTPEYANQFYLNMNGSF